VVTVDSLRDVQLVGREREVAVLRATVARAVAGDGGSLVLRGEPGVGKSALLDAAAADAGSARVLRIAGSESEVDLGYAALLGLLRPVFAGLDGLQPRQRAALAAALGLGEGVGSLDRFLVNAAALTLLADAAATRPLVSVVDDAHWLDLESLDTLAFVARRVAADPVAMLFAVRPEADRAGALAGLPVVEVGDLDATVALSLLEQRLDGRLDEGVVRRVLADTGGNPLAILELAGELTADEINRWAGVGDPESVGLAAGEVPVDEVAGGGMVRNPSVLRSPSQPLQARLAHQQPHRLVADREAVAQGEFCVHAPVAVHAAEVDVDLADQVGKPGVADRTFRWRP
jgi:AAA ATPase domain